MKLLIALVTLAVAIRGAESVGKINSDFIGTAPTSELVDAFNTWFDAQSETPTKIKVAEIPAFRLGTVAKTDIAAEELYLDIPWRVLINEDSIAASDAGAKFAALRARYKLDVSQTLLFFLLHERFRPAGAGASFWKPFVDILPASFNLPYYWADAELALLDGTGVAAAVRTTRKRRQDDWAKYRAVVEDDPKADGDGGDGGGDSIFGAELRAAFTFELYDWAYSVLDSRTIWIDGRHRCFVPMLDMVNCRDHPTRKHHTARNRGTGRTNTRAIWAARAGEQVFENYATSNAVNLEYHGFVLDDNSFDDVTLELLPPPPRALWPMLGRARAQRVYKVSASTVVARTPGLLPHARIVSLTEDEAAQYLKDEGQTFRAPVSDANEAKARALIEAAVAEKLAALAGLPEGDDAGGAGATANARTAAVFVGQQRALWRGVLDQVTRKPAAGDKVEL